MKHPKGQIDLSTLPPDDTAILAKFGDSEAFATLWAAVMPQVARIVRNLCERYPWVETEDIEQSVLMDFPKIIQRYKPEKAKSFNKYLYFSFYRSTQDALRKLDPLGIKIPHRKRYPSFSRLSDFGVATEEIILAGYENIDRGHNANLEGDEWEKDEQRQ